MEKIWYIVSEGASLGPFTIAELRRHPFVNFDTLVWTDGFNDWKPLREVPELVEAFKEDDDNPQGDFEEVPLKDPSQTDLTLAVDKNEPPYFLFWVVVACLILLYLIFQIYFAR